MVFGTMLFLIPLIFATADAELIPSKTKDLLVSWADGKLEEKSIHSILYDLEKNDLILLKNNIPQTYILPKKGQTEFVKISGNTLDYQKRAPVFLAITSPDGTISNTIVQTLETGVYFTSFILSHESRLGLYSVTGKYQNSLISPTYFIVKHPSEIIPNWFSQVVRWLDVKKITEQELISSLQYLIDHDFIQLSSSKKESKMQVKVSGEKLIRRGTTQEITILVNDGVYPVEGARVFVRVEDFGENILKEFNGFTDSSGRYIISWEIPSNAKQEKLLSLIDVTDGIHSDSIIFSFDVWCQCGETNCKCRN